MTDMNRIMNELDEGEAKSLLEQIFSDMRTVEEAEDYTVQQFFSNVQATYQDVMKEHKQRQEEGPHETIHIVFGDAASGSLKQALHTSPKETILNVADLFSIGPLWQLHTAEGIRHRYDWLQTHLNLEEAAFVAYEEKFARSIQRLQNISDDQNIVIWYGDNAHEQTALRFILYVLRNKVNTIALMNCHAAYIQHFHRDDTRHMGEMASEQLKEMYAQKQNLHVLTTAERHDFERQWHSLSEQRDVLRIWEQDAITPVPENYYDAYIVETVRPYNKRGFVKCARIVGEVIGHVPQHIGTYFIEYRIMRLIVDGLLDMEGVPSAMHRYSVKMKY